MADQLAALLAFARADKIDGMDLEVLGWLLYNLSASTINAVLKRQADGLRKSRHGNALTGAVHPKVVPRYVGEFQDSGMKYGFAETL